MINNRQNHYDSVFTEIERNVALKVIRDAVNTGKWKREEEDDLKQSVFKHLCEKRSKYITKKRYANYVRRMVKNKILNLIEIRDAQKRIPDNVVMSLDYEYSFDESGENLVLEDILYNKSDVIPGDDRSFLYEEIWNIVKNEKPIFQEIFKLWLEGHTVSSMAKKMGKKRTTVSDHVQIFKRMIKKSGLDDYLK